MTLNLPSNLTLIWGNPDWSWTSSLYLRLIKSNKVFHTPPIWPSICLWTWPRFEDSYKRTSKQMVLIDSPPSSLTKVSRVYYLVPSQRLRSRTGRTWSKVVWPTAAQNDFKQWKSHKITPTHVEWQMCVVFYMYISQAVCCFTFFYSITLKIAKVQICGWSMCYL